MPVFVSAGAINTNTPQQNGAVLIGEISINGWDANMKFNTALGGTFGVLAFEMPFIALMFDNFEFADGVINDQDAKTSFTSAF